MLERFKYDSRATAERGLSCVRGVQGGACPSLPASQVGQHLGDLRVV